MKPFAESCEQNKHVILDVIRKEFCSCKHILEIGSGTGQHAIFFASQLLHAQWQPSEQSENIPGILSWIEDYAHKNISQPISLDVENEWPDDTYDGIFSANTVHFMGWSFVIRLFEGVGKVLKNDGVFCLYGPFNYNQAFTSASNKNFDRWLKEQDPVRGIRDFDDLNRLAEANDMEIKMDYEMPANNKLLVWKKKGS